MATSPSSRTTSRRWPRPASPRRERTPGGNRGPVAKILQKISDLAVADHSTGRNVQWEGSFPAALVQRALTARNPAEPDDIKPRSPAEEWSPLIDMGPATMGPAWRLRSVRVRTSSSNRSRSWQAAGSGDTVGGRATWGPSRASKCPRKSGGPPSSGGPPGRRCVRVAASAQVPALG